MIAKILISKSADTINIEANKLLGDLGIKNPHPDLIFFSGDSKLGIAETRKIKEHFSTKPYSAKKKAAFLEDASRLTDEAQNSLLKVLEEPPRGSLIILGASSDANFLPTILSRCEIVHLPASHQMEAASDYEIYFKDIEKLIISSLEQRFEYIEKCKDREDFLQSLLVYFHKLLNSRGGGNFKFISDLLQTEEWAKANVNIRGILEYLMLVMPQKV